MNKDAEYILKAFFDYMYDPDIGRVDALDVPRETIEARLMEMGVAHKKEGGSWASNKETIVHRPTTPIFHRTKEIKMLNNLLASLPIKVQEYCRKRYKAHFTGNRQRYLLLKEIQWSMKYSPNDAGRKAFYRDRKKWEKLIVRKLKESSIL